MKLMVYLPCLVALAACGDDTGSGEPRHNRPPTAALAITPPTGAAPLTVLLDASASTDPDQASSTLRFAWDLDGDGTWDTDADARLRQHTVTYDQAGTFQVGVQVADDHDQLATAHATLTVSPATVPIADIDADTNRDGEITMIDDTGEDTWSAAQGAVLLVNWDDDDRDGIRDGNDGLANGADDMLDMARLVVRQVPMLTGSHRVELQVGPPVAAGYLRIFRDGGAVIHAPGDGDATLPATDVAAGDIELFLEAVTGRSQVWDGQVVLTLRIFAGDALASEDVATLRAAPLIFTDNTRPAEALFIMHITSSTDGPNTEFYQAMVAGAPGSVPVFEADPATYDADRWLQDNMQTGYQMAPGRVVPTYLQTERSRGPSWRPVGLAGYLPDELAGPEHGYAYPCINGDCLDSSLNYGGNIEVAPPHNGYPLGRAIVGGGNAGTVFDTNAWHDHMAQSQASWIDAQEVQGPALEVSSEWLAVGHVDEFFLFVPDLSAGASRPWKVVLASPTLARTAIRSLYVSGEGSLPVFSGRPTETTVAEIFEDSNLMTFNNLVQARIDSVRAQLETELGLAPADFVEVPVLFEEYTDWFQGTEMAVAYSPGLTNLIVLDDTLFVPDPEGPVHQGEDVFKAEAVAALDPLGVNVVFVDVFESYHLLMGEAHCGTNVAGAAYGTPWWQL